MNNSAYQALQLAEQALERAKSAVAEAKRALGGYTYGQPDYYQWPATQNTLAQNQINQYSQLTQQGIMNNQLAGFQQRFAQEMFGKPQPTFEITDDE